MPFYVKKKKNGNFMCLLEFECAKRQKVHSRAIPDTVLIIAEIISMQTTKGRENATMWISSYFDPPYLHVTAEQGELNGT